MLKRRAARQRLLKYAALPYDLISDVAATTKIMSVKLTTAIEAISATSNRFAALRSDEDLICWGTANSCWQIEDVVSIKSGQRYFVVVAGAGTSESSQGNRTKKFAACYDTTIRIMLACF